ncbi:trypsin-like peptidase domain-containing protein [Yinghuangia sp. ASG 101]|uniref:trypsin-like peptidase domain-containing protein n=1 Tax=Yinghuangia sp. ASG 101 TaxID=2896848 RepID=UPI001E3384E0|nr:trypsin-like peptidase domain-containing protein [Yinghuangia sp. ASG 101]UGQ09483.1 trypsin-like peptidase domain-containing protein [Yinghuangia sp. ASG 101]
MNHDPGDASRGADEDQGDARARPAAPGEPSSAADAASREPEDAGGSRRGDFGAEPGDDAVDARDTPGPSWRPAETPPGIGEDAVPESARPTVTGHGHDAVPESAAEPGDSPRGDADAHPEPEAPRVALAKPAQDAVPPPPLPPAGPLWGGRDAVPQHGPSFPAGGGVPGAWGFPHPAAQPYVPPYVGTPYAMPYAAPAEPEEPREPVRWTWRAAAGFACIALAAGALGGGIGAWSANRDDQSVTLRQPTASAPERPRDSVAGLAATTLPGVVYIHASKAGQQATGTGFVLDGNGDILTNNHVVADAADGGSIRVVFNGGEQVEAQVVGRDTGYDLAVIRVRNVKGLVPLPLGDSDAAQVGDPVIAIGAPYNLEGTVTSGIISAKDRAVSAGGSGEDVSYISALQTDAPINPGNSGGPLIDASGRVIGVNSAIRSATGGTDSDPFGTGTAGSIGLGFAIPINQAKRVAQQLIDDGRAVHPVIGVTLDTRYEGVGARVADGDNDGHAPVRAGGPADRAGLRAGDIVTAIDGKKVADANELVVAVRSRTPGETVRLTVQRDGGEVTLPLTLEAENGNG